MRAPLFTYAEAAQALTVSKSTVMRLCAEGKLRVHILGPRTHRIDSASVEAYLSDTLKQVEPTTCRYGKTAKRGGGVSLGGELPFLEALALAQKLTSKKPKRQAA